MKKYIIDFLRRGFIATGFGPIILAIVYLILQQTAAIEMLSVEQVCVGIFSISALAFMAGATNTVYQIERLPLMAAILIHGSVLYICYLGTYLINDWLDFGVIPIVVFSAIFIVGFMVIWAIIYSIIKNKTAELNIMLKQKQQMTNEDESSRNERSIT